jgi:hypothetical protein
LYELNSLALLGAPGAAMPAATAACWSRTTRALLLAFYDRVMNCKRRHQQHNDKHVQEQRERRTRPSVLTPTR